MALAKPIERKRAPQQTSVAGCSDRSIEEPDPGDGDRTERRRHEQERVDHNLPARRGVTDELDIGHYVMRLLAIETLFGNSDWHLRRFGERNG